MNICRKKSYIYFQKFHIYVAVTFGVGTYYTLCYYAAAHLK